MPPLFKSKEPQKEDKKKEDNKDEKKKEEKKEDKKKKVDSKKPVDSPARAPPGLDEKFEKVLVCSYSFPRFPTVFSRVT